jgi:hypothetical protein
MADVSQVIQMQRLRASAARQPVRGDKSISHLYQRQMLSSGIAEFLPNSKTKNTSATSIQRYFYIRGIHSKEKIPGGYVFGNTPSRPTRNPYSSTYDGGQPGPQTNSDDLDGGPPVNFPPFSKTADGGSPDSSQPPSGNPPIADGGTPGSTPSGTTDGGTPSSTGSSGPPMTGGPP